MTLFEYLSVAVSIVLSLSAAQILSSLRYVLQPARRYWVHAVWIFFTLYTHVILWWEFWAYREVTEWTLAKFLLVLLNPGLLFVASHALSTPESGTQPDWEDHFYAVRVSFFSTTCVLILVSIFRDAIVLGRSIQLISEGPELWLTAMTLLAAISDDRRMHAVLAVLAVALIFVITAMIWIEPGGGSLF